MGLFKSLQDGKHTTLRSLTNKQMGGERDPYVKDGLPQNISYGSYGEGPSNTGLITAQIDDTARLAKFIAGPEGTLYAVNTALNYQSKNKQAAFRDRTSVSTTLAEEPPAPAPTQTNSSGISIPAKTQVKPKFKDYAKAAGKIAVQAAKQIVSSAKDVAYAAKTILQQASVNGIGKHYFLDNGSRSYLQESNTSNLAIQGSEIPVNKEGTLSINKFSSYLLPYEKIGKSEFNDEKSTYTQKIADIRDSSTINVGREQLDKEKERTTRRQPIIVSQQGTSNSKLVNAYTKKPLEEETSVTNKIEQDPDTLRVTNPAFSNQGLGNYGGSGTIKYIETRLKTGHATYNANDNGEAIDTSDVTQSQRVDILQSTYATTNLGGLFDNYEAPDIIPFIFNIYSPDNIVGKYLHFRAYLDNFSDNYTGQWNSTQYLGRGENFYTYGGFDRKVNFSFKAAAMSRAELVPLYQKLNILAGSTAPAYDDLGRFMKGTLTNITLGDYLQNQSGFVNSIGFTWQTDYQWEINLEDSDDIIRVPHLLDVSVDFTPIHKFIPRSDLSVGALSNSSYFATNEGFDNESSQPPA
jgi:hypothetical protein